MEGGTVIDSSSIIALKYTAECNSETNLSVGDTTAASIEVEMLLSGATVTAGDRLQYIQVEDDVETVKGIFYAEAPTIASKTSCRFTAYDSKAKLTVDFSEWLSNNQALFPMTVRTLVGYACEIAGVTMVSASFDHEDLELQAFYADGVTSRQIVSWAAQLAGCFVSCTEDGLLQFAWYKQSDVTVSAIDQESTLHYMLDSLNRKDYYTQNIQRVQFKQETDDIGVIYPQNADGNVFAISQNGLAAQLGKETLLMIAESLYNKLKGISYVPLECTVKRTGIVNPGDIITITDASGNVSTTYVMQVHMDSSGTALTSTGDENYADKAAVASEEYKNIPGKILSIKKDIDGLKVENRDTEGRLTSLEMTVEGATIQVQRIIDNGVDKVTTSNGYTFNADGFRVSQSDQDISTTIKYDGTYVMRGDDPMLVANSDGVIATDVKVRNYLIIGNNSRLEDYGGNETALFYVGGESV